MTSLPQDFPAASPRVAASSDRAPRVWVGGLLLGGGLGLIVLGGCFLIGIWIMIGAHALDGPNTGNWSSQSFILMLVLYAFAFACLLGAAILIIAATRALLGLIKGDGSH